MKWPMDKLENAIAQLECTEEHKALSLCPKDAIREEFKKLVQVFEQTNRTGKVKSGGVTMSDRLVEVMKAEYPEHERRDDEFDDTILERLAAAIRREFCLVEEHCACLSRNRCCYCGATKPKEEA